MLDTEVRESGPTVNQLTQQVRELQEVKHSSSGSQDLKDFETGSSSRSTHAPSKPSVVPKFSNLPCRARCHQCSTLYLGSVSRDFF